LADRGTSDSLTVAIRARLFQRESPIQHFPTKFQNSGDLIATLRLGGVGQRRYASLLTKVCTPLILSETPWK
jgi:hypothetical protein